MRILIDRSNEFGSIRVSQIIKDLTDEFEGDIDHIDFKGLNGTFNQHIRKKNSSSLMLSAPEHFQIPLEKLRTGIRVLSVEEND